MSKQFGQSTIKITGVFVTFIALTVPSCGTGTGNPATAGPPVQSTLQSAALAGPNAAALDRSGISVALLGRMLLNLILVPQTSHAAVASFTTFKACNDTMRFVDINGNSIVLGGSGTPEIGRGLLTFSPTSTDPMTIGNISIPLNTTLSEIDITFAVVPEVCSGANYAIQFNDGVNGVIDITQNTAFKFQFPTGGTVIASEGQNITLKFGAIVTGMVSLGAGLDKDTIQTVNVGQAQ